MTWTRTEQSSYQAHQESLAFSLWVLVFENFLGSYKTRKRVAEHFKQEDEMIKPKKKMSRIFSNV